MILRSTDIRAALRSRQRGFVIDPFRFGVSAPASPAFDWNKVALALSGENLLDESQYEWAMANGGSASSQTTQFKFGTKSILFSGATATGLSASIYPAPNFYATGDATIDLWVYPVSLTSTQSIVGQRDQSSGVGWETYLLSSGAIGVQSDSLFIQSAAGAVVANVWQHVRLCIVGGATGYLFVNGVLVASGALTIASHVAVGSSTNAMTVGGTFSKPFNGYIDEVIFSDGEALTTASFAVPSAAVTRGSFSGFSTWNSGDKDASITLSAGARNASSTNSSASVRGTQGYSTGKHYFEISSIGGGTSNADRVVLLGVGKSTASLSSYPGSDANAWGFYPNGPAKYNGGSSTSYGASVDTVGVLWDATAGEISFKTSASAPSVAFSGVSGTLYPMWGQGSGAGSRQGALNTGATAFKWGLPAGYSAWG